MRKGLVFGVLVVGVIGGLAAGFLIAQPGDTPIDESPHAAALKLVIDTQATQIKAVETGDWWMDVSERTWVVRRPFPPGYFDSTHWFNVTYRINGRDAASWFVDTRTQKVQQVAIEK